MGPNYFDDLIIEDGSKIFAKNHVFCIKRTSTSIGFFEIDQVSDKIVIKDPGIYLYEPVGETYGANPLVEKQTFSIL